MAMHIDFFELIKLKTDTERLAALNSVHYSDWNTVMLWAEEAADPHARAIFERKAKDLAIRENYFFSTGKSVLIAIAPYVMLLLFLLLLAMIGVFAAVAGLSEMEEMQEIGSVLGSI